MNVIVRGLPLTMSRLTDQRGPDSPGARAGSARQTSSVNRDRPSSSTSPQHSPAAAAAAGPSSAAAATSTDEASPVSRSSNHPAGVATAVAHPRFSAVSADAHPQRTSSYHGDFHRRNRFAVSPLRAISMDAAGRVCPSTLLPLPQLSAKLHYTDTGYGHVYNTTN